MSVTDRYRRKPKSRVPAILGLLFVAFMGWQLFLGTRAAKAPKKHDPELAAKYEKEAIEKDAVRIAQNAVRRNLTFPNNADFHWGYEIEEGVLGPDTWHIKGKVDAMNAFGAKPTLNWSAIVELVNREPRQFKVIAADATP